MTNHDTKIANETELDNEKNIIKEAETSVLITLYMGIFLGMVPVIGFPIMIPEMGGKILFIGIMLGIASFISSFFMGTLFGMPKRNNKEEHNYSLNNSLVEISDWLTKIIVGLGLVNLKEIPGYLISLGEYVQTASKYDGQLLNVYAISIVIYFGFLGLYIGYNYMRLVLSNKYKNADNNLTKKELEIAKVKVIKAKEESQLKDKEIIQIKSQVLEKEQISKTLRDKVNETLMQKTDIKNVLTSETVESKSNLEKMIEEAKLKLKSGLLIHNIDPQKGQWKSSPIRNERELKATVEEESKGLFKVKLEVISTSPKSNPLKNDDTILFALHQTFGNPPFKIVKVEKHTAELNFYCYGSFTVGAFADNGTTELELDLAELPGVSSYFKNH